MISHRSPWRTPLITGVLSLLVGVGLVVGQGPVTPPGPIQVIVPPSPGPTPAPNVNPTPDPMETPTLSIVAHVGGVESTEAVVNLPANSLLNLTLTGSAVSDPDSLPHASWSLDKKTAQLSIREHGHYVSFTEAPGTTWLFSCAVNNPEPLAAPLLVQRWVVVGGVGPVPPGPAPPQPPAPVPVVSGQRELLLFYESGDVTAELARLITALRAGPEEKYLLANKHTLQVIDDDTPDASGNKDALIQKWLTELTSVPMLLVIDPVTKSLLGKRAIDDEDDPAPPADTGATVLQFLKQHGG